MTHGGALVSFILLTSSAVAVCYNFVHALMIKRTSAVATTVLGQIKIVAVILASCTILGEDFQLPALVPHAVPCDGRDSA